MFPKLLTPGSPIPAQPPVLLPTHLAVPGSTSPLTPGHHRAWGRKDPAAGRSLLTLCTQNPSCDSPPNELGACRGGRTHGSCPAASLAPKGGDSSASSLPCVAEGEGCEEPLSHVGESTRHRVSSAKLKILLQPPGWCLDGRIWQGHGLQDVQSLEGTRGGEAAPVQRRGWDTHWGTPIFPSCVSALLYNSGGCSSSAGGALPAPLW